MPNQWASEAPAIVRSNGREGKLGVSSAWLLTKHRHVADYSRRSYTNPCIVYAEHSAMKSGGHVSLKINYGTYWQSLFNVIWHYDAHVNFAGNLVAELRDHLYRL